MVTTAVSSLAWGSGTDAKEFLLHNGQRDIMLAKARFKAAIAGTGGGKTVLGPLWIATQIERVRKERDIKKEPIKGLVVAPTFPVMARATAPTLVATFAGTDLEGKYVESRNYYDLPNGLGRIWMLSADRPGGLEGGQFDWCWVDEGGQLKYDAWIAIQGRLGQRMGPCLITTTPYGQNWLFHKFHLRAKQGDPDYYIRQWPSIMNPAYPREEYERAKTSMSPQRFAMRYDGDFVKLAGLVYPDIDTCFKLFKKVPLGKHYGGIDFGWNDPFAALSSVVDENDVMYVWYERYKRFTPMRKHVNALPENVLYFADPSRPDSIDELRKGGVVVRGSKIRDIMTGVDAVNSRIYTERLVIHPKCKALFAEQQEYSYPEKDDEIVGDKPVDGFDHALDALRYLIVNVDRHRIGVAA